jgi:DNA-binding Lrp family transcriptional regulator
MANRLDDIDRRILYRLAENARDTSAPAIAEEVNVSPGTIRNRIRQLEENGTIKGYHAEIDYERAGGYLIDLLVCNTTVTDRETLARQALQVPGVVNVRELMTGRGNLHITTVGSDREDLARITRTLAELGIDIEDEDLLQREHFHPYSPFGPEEGPSERSMTDFMSLAGGAEVVDLTVTETAPVAELTLREANDTELIGTDTLVVAIERDGAIIAPRGDTTIQPGDLVTVFSRDGISDDLLYNFTSESAGE